MQLYKKESLELLRQRIDLGEVVSAHVQLHRSGASLKACCPFHEEKTPSFVIQKGDTHYHCYGCGAHGDAIAFLMSHLKLSFVEAIETLAERFQVSLEKEEEGEEKKGLSKSAMKGGLEKACRFYHFALLYTEEGHQALKYLYERGIDLEFIRLFQVGYAPRQSDPLQKVLQFQQVSTEVLEQTGLVSTSSGKRRDFFSDRITFPIRDAMGAVIGFSARKFKEDTYGGKYINTPETPLFKKSHVLYGLSYCRHRIAKDRKAIVVEGQIDALRLIHAGFNFTVAGQGTAFGESHVKELLHLGVNHVYLAMDGDDAGMEAAVKIGNLFQKKGVEVAVVSMPPGDDPDSILKERGPPGFLLMIDESRDYLTFLFHHLSKNLDISSPSKKNELVQKIASAIREWEQPVMVHESLKKLAKISNIPESMVGITEFSMPESFVKRAEKIIFGNIDPDRILETDLLRWMLLMGETHPRLIDIVQANLVPEHFRIEVCRRVFSHYLEMYSSKKPRDLLSFALVLNSPDDQALFSVIMQKKVNLLKAEEMLIETIKKILQRQWMEEREKIKMKIHSGACTEDEVLELARQFDEIKRQPPEVKK
ncbi:MAG TPA: DNA primase [Rhabdochlamydiaceae bacterium]|nr:DNA primase [Rhabdochlamydiaceae bacterium]